MISVRRVLTASNTDVLSGTDLENLPGPGVMTILAASTQSDTTLTVTGRGFEVPVRDLPLQLTTSGFPTADGTPPVVFEVPAGGKVILDLTEVTAATMVIEATYLDAEEAAALAA